MNFSNVVLETPLILEKTAFTSTVLLFLQRQNSRDEYSDGAVHTAEENFRPNYDRIKLKRLSVLNLSLCVICRSDIKYHNQRRTLQCEHAFHIKCIKQWIAFQNICPICRIDLN